MRFPVPGSVLEAINRLNDSGHEAYLVGGCVRDDYLHIPPHDYDICTSAYPEEIKACFREERTIDTGIRHGTVTVLLEGHSIEITTYRADGPYSDGRRPDHVSFTHNLAEDLKRRDFTMNALAWHPSTGIVDMFGGREDCDNRLIRCVGQARHRFNEDALRILRALRFASTLGFSIEQTALEAMEERKASIRKVSVERIATELNKLMLGAQPAEVFRQYPRIMFEALPSLEPMFHCPQRSIFHCYDVWDHTLHALEDTPPDLAVRWAALYHDSGKPGAITYDPDGTTHFRGHQGISTRIVEQDMTSLRQPNALIKEITTLVKYHDERIGPDNLQAWLSKLGHPLFIKLMMLQRADLGAHAPDVAAKVGNIDNLVAHANEIANSDACLSLRDLAVDGRMLVENGFGSGPFLGETLQYLLQRVVNGFEPNDQRTLLSIALKRLKEYNKQ